MKKIFTIIILLFTTSAFAQVKPFIPKQDQELPDNYGVKICYVSLPCEEFEIASHRLNDGLFEFETKDDLWNWVPMTSVARIEFDKRFSKIMAVKEKRDRNKLDSKASNDDSGMVQPEGN